MQDIWLDSIPVSIWNLDLVFKTIILLLCENDHLLLWGMLDIQNSNHSILSIQTSALVSVYRTKANTCSTFKICTSWFLNELWLISCTIISLEKNSHCPLYMYISTCKLVDFAEYRKLHKTWTSSLLYIYLFIWGIKLWNSLQVVSIRLLFSASNYSIAKWSFSHLFFHKCNFSSSFFFSLEQFFFNFSSEH